MKPMNIQRIKKIGCKSPSNIENEEAIIDSN